MRFFPAPQHSVSADTLNADPVSRPSRFGASRSPSSGATHEVIWSESLGTLIDIDEREPFFRPPVPGTPRPAKQSARGDTLPQGPGGAGLREVHPSPRSSPRILIADDNASLRETLAWVLSDAGYTVSCAEDGEEAWAALRARCFDCLITDHDMPRLKGLDLLRRLQVSSLDVPALLMSGAISVDRSELSHLLAPEAVLQKPFSLTELLARVRAVLAPNGRAKAGNPRPAGTWGGQTASTI